LATSSFELNQAMAEAQAALRQTALAGRQSITQPSVVMGSISPSQISFSPTQPRIVVRQLTPGSSSPGLAPTPLPYSPSAVESPISLAGAQGTVLLPLTIGEQAFDEAYNTRVKEGTQEAYEFFMQRFIIGQNPCPDDIIEDMAIRLINFNELELKKDLSGIGMFQPTYQQGATCFVNTLLYMGGVLNPRTFRTWARRFHQISAGSFGVTMEIGNLTNSLFLLKAQSSEDRYDSLAHEAAVGFLVTNELRRIIPNFTFIYGAFLCQKPNIENGEVISWCPAPKAGEKEPTGIYGRVGHLVMENATLSISAHTFVRQCSETEFLELYLQIINALRFAHEAADFTHYDLHSGNVLVRRVQPEPLNIRYKTAEGVEMYLVTKIYARIIDYGFSHFRYQGYNFGIKDMGGFNIFWDKGFPMHDAYKFLLSCADQAGKYNKAEIYRLCAKLYRFFIFEDPTSLTSPATREQLNEAETLLTERISFFRGNRKTDYLQAPLHLANLKYTDLLRFMEKEWDLLHPQAPIKIQREADPNAIHTTCGDPSNPCLYWDELMTQMFSLDTKLIGVAEYQHILQVVETTRAGELYDRTRLRMRDGATEAIQRELAELDQLIPMQTEFLEVLEVPQLSPANPPTTAQLEELQLIAQDLTKAEATRVAILEILERIIYVATRLNIPVSFARYRDLMTRLEEVYGQIRNGVKQNIDIYNSNPQLRQRILALDPNFDYTITQLGEL